MLTFSIIFIISGLSFGKNWPLPELALEEILNRSNRWIKLSQEKKMRIRTDLIYALHLAGSLEAKKVFFGHVGEFWDSNSSLKQKQDLIKEAELLALESAKKIVEKWAEAKGTNGKFMSANTIINQLAGGNLATERFHEWDKFLNDQGDINYKSWPLGADASLPEEERPSVDLIRVLSIKYPGNPSERKEEALKRAEAYRTYFSYGHTNFYPRSDCDSAHSGSMSLRPCGTPSSNAPTIRPELNGQR